MILLCDVQCVVCFRALIIRGGEILPMSSSFTPESERQRLQFLVREIWIQLLALGSACPSLGCLFAFFTDYGIHAVFLSQAHLQPSLLGNDFTHLEFPRRVTKKEVGKRMLYRDFTMNGW